MVPISINFLGGSHGNFLQRLLTVAFTNNNRVDENTTSNGTWHLSNGGTCISAAHFWWLTPNIILGGEKFTPFDKWDYPNLEKNVVHITPSTLIAQALICSYWRRHGEIFCFSPSELLNMDEHTFSTEWQRRQCDDVDTVFLEQQRLKANRLFCFHQTKKEIFKNGVVDEASLIHYWATRNWQVNYGIKYNNIWRSSISTDHIVVDFDMLWLYDVESALRGVNIISSTFGIDIISPTDRLVELLTKFKLNLHELPGDLAQVSAAFYDFENNIDSSLQNLSINGKILLLIMIYISSNFTTAFNHKPFHKFPESTVELARSVR